ERLNRIGGRLDADIIEFEGGAKVREEEGGVRFTSATCSQRTTITRCQRPLTARRRPTLDQC
ncbi:MAG: hypothetical protein ACI9TF_000149, partial [Paracrocinitomix sp.]